MEGSYSTGISVLSRNIFDHDYISNQMIVSHILNSLIIH